VKLSIITINFNNAVGLIKTFESVFSQTYTGFEYIVIDGNSSDDSKNVIDQHSDKINYWVSEKDNGVYHAMNKGIEKANGEYLLFLNSGDCLLNESVLKTALSGKLEESIVYCDVKSNTTGEVLQFPDDLKFSFFYEATLNHQCTFIKKNLFEKYGLYNTKYKIASDWLFFMQCIFLYNESTRHMPLVLVLFDYTDGISTRESNFQLMNNERSAILSEYFGRFYEDYKAADIIKQRLFIRNENSLKMNRKIIRIVRKIRSLIK